MDIHTRVANIIKRLRIKDIVLTAPIKKVVRDLTSTLSYCNDAYAGCSETQDSSKRSESKVRSALQGADCHEIKKTDTKPSICIEYESPSECFGISELVDNEIKIHVDLAGKNGVFFLHQPFGTQAYPDIILLHVEDGKLIQTFNIEVKGGDCTWNTHLTRLASNNLYILFDKNVNFMYGRHVRSVESLALAIDHDIRHRKEVFETNEYATRHGLLNKEVAYPKHEMSGEWKKVMLTNRTIRHVEIIRSLE